jgi:hypothetical protein
LENSIEVPQKVKTIPFVGSSNPSMGIDPNEMKSVCQTDVCMHVCCSIIHNSQEMESALNIGGQING